MKNLKIGVTIGLKALNDSIWTNGIHLNSLILARLLKQSSENYEVYVLNVLKPETTEKSLFLKEIDFYQFEEKFLEMDLLIMIGGSVDDTVLRRYKASGKNKRVVGYHCGNSYMLLIQSILFKDSAQTPFTFETYYDEVWYVPQQHETNSGFFRTLHRTNAITAPFIWDPYFIQLGMDDINNGFKAGAYKRPVVYQPCEKKTLGSMEPNIDVVKFGLIPLMIAEECYRTPIGRKHIAAMMVTNGEKLGKHRQFMDIAKTFDLFADKKISADARYQTSFLLTQHIDVLICHQHLNPLNYLYLDAAYMGRPLLHNAHLVRDLGYYYEGSDTREAAQQLTRILTEHDAHIEEYNARNQAVLWRYTASNPELIATYDRMIERLFNGSNDGLRYNAATNLYLNEK